MLLWEIFALGGTPYPQVGFEELRDRLEAGMRMGKPVNAPESV